MNTRKLINKVLLPLCIFFAYIPYLNGFYGTALVLVSIIPMIIMVTLYMSLNMTGKTSIDIKLLSLFFILNIISLIAGFGFGGYDMLIHFLRYNIIGVMCIVFLPTMFYKNTVIVSKTIVFIATILALLGFLSIAFGQFDIGFLTVKRYFKYYFFGVYLPTSSSLLWNTNYYGIVQLISLPFCLFLYKSRQNKKGILIAQLIIIIISIILTGSRSAIYMMMVFFLFLALKLMFKRINVIMMSFMCTISAAVIVYISPNISNLFLKFKETNLMNKGLNGRDVITQATLEMIKHRPMGYGYSAEAISQKLTEYASITGATQSSYLLYLLRGGYLGLIVFCLIIAYCTFSYLIDKSKREDLKITTFFYVLMFIVGDSFVRSYSVGGTGLITMFFTISLAIMVLPKTIYKKNKDYTK